MVTKGWPIANPMHLPKEFIRQRKISFGKFAVNLERVSPIAVISGGFIGVGTSSLAGVAFAYFYVLKPQGFLAHTVLSGAIHASHVFCGVRIVTGLLCSILGGFWAAFFAGRHERLNGTLSSYFSVAQTLLLTLLGIDKGPLCGPIVVLVASPGMGYLGGALRHRMRTARAAPSAMLR